MPKRKAVQFVPPPPEKTTYDWTQVAAEARSHPMEWGRVYEGDRQSVFLAATQGKINAIHRDLGFEFRSYNNKRTFDDASGKERRTCDMWIRFNPDRVKPVRAAVNSAKKGK